MTDQREAPPQAAPEWKAPGPDHASASKAIVRLAGPMAMSDVFTLVVMIAVVALMARMSGDALYVRALYLPLVSLFVAIYAGIGISGQVAAAISRGQGRPQDVLPVAWSFVRVWLVLSAVLIVALALAAPLLATLFNTDPANRDTFIWFVRWMAPAELAQVGYVLCASILRGFDLPKDGMTVVLLAGFVQIGGIAVAGLGLGLGLYVVPVSIAVGSLAGMVLGVVLLRRAGLWAPRQWTRWRGEAMALLKQVGLPVAGTQIILFAGNTCLLWVLRDEGERVVSGFSAAMTVQVLLIMPGIVIGSATAIVLNQQRGAGRPEWMPAGLQAGMRSCAVLYGFLAIFAWIGQDAFAGIMTGDPPVAAETAAYLNVIALTYVVQGPVLAALTSMEQLGAGVLAVLLNVVYYAIIIVAGRLLVDSYGALGVYRAIAAANVVGVIVLVVAFLVVRRLSRRPSALPS